MTHSASKKSDISLLNKTLFKLSLPRLITRTLIIALVALVWLFVANELLAFGQQQDYAFLQDYSKPAAQFLLEVNDYIWWGIVLVGTIILWLVLSSWIENSIRAAGFIIPKKEVMEHLLPQLSPEAKDVLLWVWGEQREPITLKNLHDTRYQLRSGRAKRLALIRQHRELLGLPQAEPTTALKQDVDNLLSTISLDLEAPEEKSKDSSSS